MTKKMEYTFEFSMLGGFLLIFFSASTEQFARLFPSIGVASLELVATGVIFLMFGLLLFWIVLFYYQILRGQKVDQEILDHLLLFAIVYWGLGALLIPIMHPVLIPGLLGISIIAGGPHLIQERRDLNRAFREHEAGAGSGTCIL